MKKTILFLMIFCCIATVSFAQFSIGAKAGISISNLRGAEITTEPNVLYKMGIPVQYMFSKWGIESGLYFSQAGSSSLQGVLDTKSGGNYMAVMTIRTNYLELPLSLVYKQALNSCLNLLINGGGYLAYGIGGKGFIDYHRGGFSISPFNEINSNNQPEIQNVVNGGARRLDYGVSLGAGIEINGLIFGLSYNLGLADVYDKLPIHSESKNIKNGVFSISAGYRFTL